MKPAKGEGIVVLEIIEILGPSDQGKTKPYLCRGEDDTLYYVKGRNSGTWSQCCEWVVGSLAQAFGLPVAPFKQVNISSELLAEAKIGWRDIGEGIAFASEKQDGAYWFEPNFVFKVPQQLRMDVLAFDWWVRNMDRQIDNPNLLWADASSQLVVIDYGFSFDDSFFPTVFQGYHIFSSEKDRVFSDLASQAQYANRFATALSVWEVACDNLPPAWLAQVGSGTGDAFDLPVARQILERCLSNELWRVE